VPSDELDLLQNENDELRRRIAAAQAVIDELRTEALERRREVRAMAEALPTAMSRHALVRQMLHDARGHPDKGGVAARAIRKLGRAPRKLVRVVLGRR
jgi:uncharacterized small protein (DUF1192 family)